MKIAKFTTIWLVGIAFLLSGVTGWAQVTQVCHSPRTSFRTTVTAGGFGGGGDTRSVTVVKNYAITKDIEASNAPDIVGKGEDYRVFYHPFGESTIETTVTITGFTGGRPPVRHVMKTNGPVFEDCCNCGDNENTAYQLKIYSKDQDPTRGENFDKPVLVTQGFDVSYLLPNEQFTFANFQILLDSVFDEIDTSRPPVNETGLLRQLYDEGYDVALLLWKNPNIHIPHNALVILQALRWLERPHRSEGGH